MDEYWTHEETAAKLRMAPATLHYRRHKLQEPGIFGIPIGGKLLYPVAEIEAWIEKQRAEYLAEVEARRAKLEELG